MNGQLSTEQIDALSAASSWLSEQWPDAHVGMSYGSRGAYETPAAVGEGRIQFNLKQGRRECDLVEHIDESDTVAQIHEGAMRMHEAISRWARAPQPALTDEVM